MEAKNIEEQKKEKSMYEEVIKPILLQSFKNMKWSSLKATFKNKTERTLYALSFFANPAILYFLLHNRYFLLRIDLIFYVISALFGYFFEKGTYQFFFKKENTCIENNKNIKKNDISTKLKNILEAMNVKTIAYMNTVESDVETRYRFKLSCDIKKLVRDTDNIEHKLGLKKGRLTIENDEGVTTFVIKKPVVKNYYLDKVVSDNPNPPKEHELPFVLGCEYSTGKTLFGDLAKTKHLVIGGKTGVGKSTTFETVIETLMYYNPGKIAFYMIDFCESALVKYEDFANVKFVECGFNSVLNSLKEIYDIYEHRRKLFREAGVINISEYNKISSEKIPYIILTVDEANGFKEDFTQKQFDQIDDLVKMTLKRGRKYGIFTIQAVQRTQDTDFSMAWKSQMSRIGHSMNDLSDCQNLSPNKEIAEKMLKLDTGEFYLVLHAGSEPIKIKGCYKDSNIGKKKRKNQQLYWILKKGYDKNAFENFIFKHKKMEKTF